MENRIIHKSNGGEGSHQRLLTIEEVSEFTSLAVGTLYRMVGAGRIPVVRISRRCIRFSLPEVIRWIEERTVRPQDSRR